MLSTFWRKHRRLALEWFAVINLGFLALDIFIAHSVNDFRHRAEWIPFVFSIVAPGLLCIEMLRNRNKPLGEYSTALGIVVGYGSILIGMAGMYFHLNSAFFAEQTIKSLVYSAPFAAPLAYAGLGLLVLLNRMVDSEEEEWGYWIVFLALGGFVGNFALSLLDHAQNGFFVALEWIPVCSAAIAIGFLLAPFWKRPTNEFLGVALWVMATQSLVGMIGFTIHFEAMLNGPGGTLLEKIIFGAPLFAPLLFVNLSALGAAGLWNLRVKESCHP